MPPSQKRPFNLLLLGAGMVSDPIVEYFAKQSNDAGVRIIVATRSRANGERLVQIAPKCVELVVVDVQNEPDRILQLIERADLCISLLPYIHHVAIAKMCIQKGTNMLTSSYISPGLQELDEAATAAGITVMNEAGLDPGIDHMLAMQCIDQIHAEGGKVRSFVSFCGGLPSPEASDNPLRYKFSWSPKGMLLALLNPAKYLKDGRLVEVEGNCGVLDAQYPIRFMPGFNFIAYPNRDSTKYASIYGIEGECRTLLRGTLRFQGFVEAIKVLKTIGFLTPMNENKREILQDILEVLNCSWRQLCAFLLGLPDAVSTEQLKATLAERLNFVGKEQGIEAVEQLGLFSDAKLPETNIVTSDTLLDMLAQHLAATLKYADGERDLVVLVHDLEAEFHNGQIECHQISLTAYGDQDKAGGYSAMARTVGYTCAITAHMMLKGEITQKGMLRPVSREIYEPILEGLKRFGIRARATRTMAPNERGKL